MTQSEEVGHLSQSSTSVRAQNRRWPEEEPVEMPDISDAERAFIVDGAAAGVRADGRSPLSRRPVTLETGILPTASGSARARIGGGVTDVLVGVTASIAEPGPESPDCGFLEFSVEFSSLASPDFTGRGADESNAELAMLLSRLYASPATETLRKSLSLIPGRKCWALHVDTLVLDSDGSIVDAASLAVRSALRTALLPKVVIVPGEADEEDDVQVDEGSLAPLEHAECSPVAVSAVALGNTHVADPTSFESSSARALVCAGVGATGQLCGTVVSAEKGLDPAELKPLLATVSAIGKGAVKQVDSFVDEYLKRRTSGELPAPVGFFG